MTDNPDLLRAVLDTPADLHPRLVYADWLEECGQEARSAFVRVQRRTAQMTRVYDPVSPLPPDHPAHAEWKRHRQSQRSLLCASIGTREGEDRGLAAGWYVDLDLQPEALPPFGLLRGGFVAEIHAPLLLYFGGPCGCGGWPVSGRRARMTGPSPEPVGADGRCVTCSGSGDAPGVAPALFASQPVTRVRLPDRIPNPGHGWFADVGDDTTWEAEDSHPNCLPWAIAKHLPGTDRVRRQPFSDFIRCEWPYRSEEDARDALERVAAVNWGRSVAAGLTHFVPCPGSYGAGQHKSPPGCDPPWACPVCNGTEVVARPGLAPLPAPAGLALDWV